MELHPRIVEVLERVGIKELNEVQKRAFGPIYRGGHTLIIAPTGSGKTEAALIPVLQRLLEERWQPIAVLYITPLRALNRDLLERIRRWGELLGLDVAVRHGDTSDYERSKQAKKPPHILITTPETLQAILPAEKMGKHLSNVKAVIIDEVHELVSEKRGYQLALALERLRVRAGNFQRIGLSATVGSPSVAAQFLGGKEAVNIVDVTAEKRYIIHVLYPRPTREDEKEAKEMGIDPHVYARIKAILRILGKHKQVITFVNTRSMAEQLSFYLKTFHKETEVHHSSLSKETRILAERLFKRGKIKHIIATSSLELGIDVGEVDAVIQYGSPRQVIRLIQRVGRSGHRWDRPSVGYIIATGPMDYLEALAIKEFAERRVYEPIRYEENPLDVLAHQVAGFVMDLGEIEIEELYERVRRAFPFFNLPKEELLAVINQLQSERFVKVVGDRMARTRSTWRYYYENLSMIPDEEKFFVVDVTTKKNVAMLDEDFVAEYIEPGVIFVVRGRTWRVLSVEGRNILVEEVVAGGAIPAWIGEQIPVEPFVAREVRRRLEEGRTGEASWFFKNYKEPGEVVVEKVQQYVVVHAFLGSRGNQTLARLLASEITRRFGIPVRVYSTPYVVVVEFPEEGSVEMVREVLEGLPPDLVDVLLERVLPRTVLFRTRFVHVARRFGLISRKASGKVNIRKIVELLTDSPVFTETLRELYTEKLDLDSVKMFLKDVRVKEVGPTPVGRAELSSVLQKPDILLPEDPAKVLREKFKERVLNSQVWFICLYCGFTFKKRVKDVPDKLLCPSCGSPLLAVSKDIEKDKEAVKKREGRRYAALLKSAELVKHFGKKAVIAQAVEGIGPTTAARLLIKPFENEEEFWDELMKAEREYFRTRVFWKG